MSEAVKAMGKRGFFSGMMPMWGFILVFGLFFSATFIAARQTSELRQLRHAVAVATRGADDGTAAQLRAQIGAAVCRGRWSAAFRRAVGGTDECAAAVGDDDLRAYCASVWNRWSDTGLLCDRF